MLRNTKKGFSSFNAFINKEISAFIKAERERDLQPNNARLLANQNARTNERILVNYIYNIMYWDIVMEIILENGLETRRTGTRQVKFYNE